MRLVVVLFLAALTASCTPPKTVPAGGACDADNDCQAGVCVAAVSGGEGRCTATCDNDASCSNGSVCAVGTAQGAAVKACLPPLANGRPASALCQDNAQCQTGACVDHVCRSLCANSCAVGETCVASTVPPGPWSGSLQTGACFWTNAYDGVSLGPVPTAGMESVDIPFTVPDGVGSFTVLLVDDEALRLSVTRLTSPDGTVLFNPLDMEADLNPGTQYIGAAAMMVPSSDAVATQAVPGTWVMRVGTFEPNNFEMLQPLAGTIEHVTVVFEPRAEEGGSLDVMVHLAPGVGVAAVDAPDAGFTADMVTRARSYLTSGFGVNLAEVAFEDLPEEHNVVEDGNEVRSLCRQRAQAGPRGITVNVFVVDDLSFTSGFAGGIPGLPGVYRTNASGVVLEALGNGNQTGILLAHELGHYLGLRHTTELTGGRTDPITDTPECPRGSTVENCPDYSNLMFPTFPLLSSLTVTPGQRAVVRMSPHLYDPLLTHACAGLPPAPDLTDTRFAQGTFPAAGTMAGACGGDGGEVANIIRVPAGVTRISLSLDVTGGSAALYARVNGCQDGMETGCALVQAGTTGTLALEVTPQSAVAVMVDAHGGTPEQYTLRWAPVTP